jgi:hypothetical protein
MCCWTTFGIESVSKAFAKEKTKNQKKTQAQVWVWFQGPSSGLSCTIELFLASTIAW